MLVPGDELVRGALIAHVARDEGHVFLRNGPGKPGREVVEHHDRLAGIHELENHVAADIAGAARDQNRHLVISLQSQRSCIRV